MRTLLRTARFTGFTLVEYARSGRIIVETLATLAVFYILFRRWGTGINAEYLFTYGGLFALALTFYTASAVMGLGDRPQGYVVLMRRLGRGGYLLGLYMAALAIELAAYGALNLAVALLNPVGELTIGGWLLGTIPLVLNVALLTALLTLLAPMVLSGGWRLAILAIVAIAFSGNLLGGPTLTMLGEPLTQALSVLRTIFSTPLLPAFTGFSLSVTRDYGGVNAAIPFAQLSLTLGLLALALFAFTRRDLIFTGS